MHTLDAIQTRRSIRAFTDEAVPPELFDTLIGAALAAPSGGNAHPLVFISVQAPARLRALLALSPGIITPPPAVVVIAFDARLARSAPDGPIDSGAWIDLGAAVENLLLAAVDQGYGACPILSFHPGGVRLLLDLPEHLEPCLLVTIGRPRVTPTARIARPLADQYYKEQYAR